MSRKSSLKLIGDDNNWNKLAYSPHWKWIISAVKDGMKIKTLWRVLNEEKKYSVSLPTVKKAVRYIRANDCDTLKLLERNRKAAMAITEDVKEKVPALANTLKRRASLISELLERKNEVLNAQKEGERVKKLFAMLDELSERVNCQNAEMIDLCIKNIRIYIAQNFTEYQFKGNLETIIRQYIMDIHEIFKYAEQWTAKYDIYNLLEKLALDLSASAIKVFGKYLSNLTEEERIKVVDDYKREVKSAMRKIEVDELKIEDEDNYDETKYQ